MIDRSRAEVQDQSRETKSWGGRLDGGDGDGDGQKDPSAAGAGKSTTMSKTLVFPTCSRLQVCARWGNQRLSRILHAEQPQRQLLSRDRPTMDISSTDQNQLLKTVFSLGIFFFFLWLENLEISSWKWISPLLVCCFISKTEDIVLAKAVTDTPKCEDRWGKHFFVLTHWTAFTLRTFILTS